VCLFIRNLSVAVSGQLFYFGVLFAAYFHFTFEFVCFLFNFIEMINDLKLKYKFESSIVICAVERSFFYEHLIWGELGEIYYPTLESQIHFFPVLIIFRTSLIFYFLQILMNLQLDVFLKISFSDFSSTNTRILTIICPTQARDKLSTDILKRKECLKTSPKISPDYH
jgi:hypothetical protein